MNESNIFGISVRALLAFVIVVSCCALALITKDMPVLKELALIATGYLFGKVTSNSNGGSNAQTNSSSNPTSNANSSQG
jgi:hypothetical protein